MSLVTRILLPILLALLLACASAEMEPTAIQKVVEGIINADNNADLNAVLSFYSDEAILLPPREPPIKGLKGIEENYRNIFANSFLDLKVQIDTIQVSRDLAVCRGQLGTIT